MQLRGQEERCELPNRVWGGALVKNILQHFGFLVPA